MSRHICSFSHFHPIRNKPRSPDTIQITVSEKLARVKSGQVYRTSGKFGHTFANSANPDETAPFTVCLVNLVFIPII